MYARACRLSAIRLSTSFAERLHADVLPASNPCYPTSRFEFDRDDDDDNEGDTSPGGDAEKVQEEDLASMDELGGQSITVGEKEFEALTVKKRLSIRISRLHLLLKSSEVRR